MFLTDMLYPAGGVLSTAVGSGFINIVVIVLLIVITEHWHVKYKGWFDRQPMYPGTRTSLDQLAGNIAYNSAVEQKESGS